MVTESNRSKPNSKIPPSILTFGAFVAKIFEWLTNMDFLISMRSETFLLMFQVFIDYGIWLFFGGGIVWGIVAWKYPAKGNFWPSMVAVTGILAFVWGVLVTAYATGTVPKVLMAWGSSASGECSATLDTSRLSSFRKDYQIALICGIVDPRSDRFTDTRISISSPRTVERFDRIIISIPYSQQMAEAARNLREGEGKIWHIPVLIPKDADMLAIHSLSDVSKYKGKILSSGY